MNMQLSLKLPDTIQVSQKDIELIIAYSLFDKGHLTSGQAAGLVGLSQRAFLENAHIYNVSPYQYDDPDELNKEISQWQ